MKALFLPHLLSHFPPRPFAFRPLMSWKLISLFSFNIAPLTCCKVHFDAWQMKPSYFLQSFSPYCLQPSFSAIETRLHLNMQWPQLRHPVMSCLASPSFGLLALPDGQTCTVGAISLLTWSVIRWKKISVTAKYNICGLVYCPRFPASTKQSKSSHPLHIGCRCNIFTVIFHS